MIVIQTTTQKIILPDGSLATGTISLQPHVSFEYDEGAVRQHVSKSITLIHIENGVITDGAGNAATVSVAPTSGGGNDIANNYYDAVWQMNGATLDTQKWSLDAATTPVELLDIPLVSTPQLPIITIGTSGAVVMNWQGTFNAGTNYSADATVASAGRSFIGLQDGSVGHTPPATGSGNTWWALLADKGANGSSGLDGTNGTNGLDGAAGTNGLDGTAGTNGLDGTNGTNGTNGLDGQSVDHVTRTIGNGAPGTTDTYTVWGGVGATINLGTFLVYNGANGSGAGDMTKAVYDPTNINASAFDMTNMVEAANALILTPSERANITNNTLHAASAHAPANATVNSTDAALLARANHTGTQTLATISDSGTAAARNVPAAGDAGAGEVVTGSDTRLTDNRTPTPHTHSAVDTVDFDAAVANNAAVALNTAKVSADGFISTHSNVSISNLIDGQELIFDAVSQNWKNQTPIVGATAQQAADIATNNAKVSDVNHVAALLPNVDNTADTAKPVSALQQTALDGKEASLSNPTTDGFVLSSTIAGVRSWIAQTIGAALNVAQSFTAAQRVTPVALTDAATVAMDASLSNFYTLVLAGNRTLGLPTNLVAGQSGSIKIAQDATGTRTLAFNAVWKFVGGTAPTLTTTASAVDRLDYYVVSATEIHTALAADVK